MNEEIELEECVHCNVEYDRETLEYMDIYGGYYCEQCIIDAQE